MKSFRKAASKDISLYLEKGKLFILFWLLSFTMVAKKNTFSEEFLLPEKILRKKTQTKKITCFKNVPLLNVSCKESNFQYFKKLICSSYWNLLPLFSFLKYDR